MRGLEIVTLRPFPDPLRMTAELREGVLLAWFYKGVKRREPSTTRKENGLFLLCSESLKGFTGTLKKMVKNREISEGRIKRRNIVHEIS